MSLKKKISLTFVLLSVVLVLAHNLFPHHHSVGHKKCASTHQTHVCASLNEVHISECGDHSDLCKTVYEFLSSSSSQVSHAVQVAHIDFDVKPHVCTCKHIFNIENEVEILDQFWRKNLPKRAPPVLA